MNHARSISLWFALVVAATAQEDLPEGHSGHGAVFNDGPRQAAYTMAGCGEVHFEATVSDPALQELFNQGVGQLHGFWYFEAERTFRHIAARDSGCAMAYWGMAMANVDNGKRAAGFARVAWLKRGLASPRERLYIDAVARFHDVSGPESPRRLEELDEEESKKFEDALRKRRQARGERLARDYEEIIWEYPDDIEAKAFLTNRLWLNRRLGSTITSRQANEALLQQIFAVSPEHPAHHYRIHLWDEKETAERVVDSAVRCGLASPGIAHMWHMGGHIFAQLGRHSDAAWQQEASARVDHAHMMRDRVLPDQIHNFAHNNEWLVRSLRHHGRVREAVSLAKNMIELPRHPRYNTLEKGGCSASYGRRRLLETLELFERWEELIALSETMYLESSDEAGDRAERAHLLAKAHAYTGDEMGFETQLAALDSAIAAAKADRVEAMESAEEDALQAGASGKEVREDIDAALDKHQRILDRQRDKREALVALRAALAGEELDDNLEVLRKRGFTKSHLARLCLDLERPELAVKLARKGAENKHGQLYPNAVLAHTLFEAGETEEALELFDELRAWTAQADLDLPVLQRLAPLAEARGLPADWRPLLRVAEDLGQRVDLERLGPLRWSAPAAQHFNLPGADGESVSLADYSGRPVVLIFFLGLGCVHCVEQLNAFSPVTELYKDAGIVLLAIGTDSVEELLESQREESEEQAFTFPILADPELVHFKRWNSHDDFEGVPLHGTFLIDGRGRVRWHDISYEPFMDHEFLLEEAQRLLGLPDRIPSAKAVVPQSAVGG